MERIRADKEKVIAHIHSQKATRSSLYILAAVCVVITGLIIIFAPSGRERAVEIVATAFLVLAAGSAGYSTFVLKARITDLEATVTKADEDIEGLRSYK